MNTKIRYDLDSLELANGDFGYPITEKEVRKVNRMLELMENVRSRQMCPTEGDCVEFVSRSGDYFGKAHIERITGKYADICLIPETVFCFDDMGKAAYDTTGSPWTQVNIRNMKRRYRNPHIQDMGIREAQQYGQSKVRCSGQEMGIQRTESVV